MKVQLVSFSKPSENFLDQGLENVQDLIAFCARVSNPSNQINKETSEKLIKYLIKHQHWSPLEMVSACLEIETTRDIARQILRHRSFSFQEFSQRYAVSENFTNRQARLQDPKNRQNSIPIEVPEATGGEGSVRSSAERLYEDWNMKQREVINKANDVYKWALHNGIAKEQARAVLPEGNTETTLYMAGSLRSWIHFCKLRMGVETQKEHRIVAQQCWEHIKIQFPHVAEALEDGEL